MSEHEQDHIENPETPETPTESAEKQSSLMDVMKLNMKLEPSTNNLKPRAVKRIMIMVVLLLGLAYGFYWFISKKGDFVRPSDTSKMIGAVKVQDSGAQAVVLDESGKITESDGWEKGKTDRDIAWDPQGNRLFFISDRKESTYHIFRWDPERNGSPDQKSIDAAGRSNLRFDAQDTGKGDLSALVLVRGTVQEFTPQTAKSTQIMPPVGFGTTEEGGKSSYFDTMYKNFGTSFNRAVWFGNRRYVAATMRREDRGESLVVQDLEPDKDGKPQPPHILMVGERFDLSVNPANGALVFSVMHVLPMLKMDGSPMTDDSGKVPEYDFEHGVFMFDPGKGLGRVTQSPKGAPECFTAPVVSPDGKKILFVVGKYKKDTAFDTMGLFEMSLEQPGQPTLIDQGEVSDPAFGPDSNHLAFIKRDNNYQAIFVGMADNTVSPKNITGSSGNFMTPIFSPQYK